MDSTQNPGVNSNEKTSPPAHMQQQQQPSVPSIFLGPAQAHPPLMEINNTSTNQTTQTSVWNSGSGMEMQRVRIPPSVTSTSGSMDNSYKMKSCVSTQCGSYEGLSNMPAGACQPPIQTRMYPPYMQQQQQMTMPIRSMHQHHHHGIAGPCHPHHPAQSMGVAAPHLDRMMHSTVASAGGNLPYMDYSHAHTHHHHHNGPHGISAAAAAAAQYAHQQQQQQHQRMVNSAAATLNPYRQLPTHHHQKVINASQAAAAYQSAYQHQYNQYHGMVHSHSAGSASLNPYYRQLPANHQQINSSQAAAAYQSTYQHHHQYNQYHGMLHPHSHPHHQNGQGVASVMPQRMLGIPIAQQQQQARMVPYLNRTCQPHLLANYATGAAQHQQQQLVNHVEVSGGVFPNSLTTQAADLNNNHSSSSKSVVSSSSGTKSLNKKASSEALILCHKDPQSSSFKIKLTTASPEKSPVKIKATRSVTKLRDRQPRLSVGQKKKSAGNLAVTASSRKLKSLKSLNSAGVATNVENSGKRLTSSMVESEGNGDAKRSRKVAKTEDVLGGNSGVGCETQKVSEENSETKTTVGDDETVGELSNKSVTDNYFLEEQSGDEYVPTSEEMRKYLERLNTCNNLNIPLYFAYSVFHGKLSKKDNASNSSGGDSSSTPTTTTEGIITTLTTTTTSTTICYQNYHQHRRNQQQNEFNIATYNNWNDAALSADTEWQQFQDDMAVLEACFPLLSTMEQSERAEKLDTIYSYEGQMKLMNSATPAACPVVGADQISPPCSCVQDTSSCSCCYNYLPLPTSMGSSPEECGRPLVDQLACRNSSFVGDSPQQFVMETGYDPQPHFMSTPLSSRRPYAGGTHYYDEENGYYFKDSVCSRTRLGARKRSSSYPSRKSGRRTSGSRDHLKSETESFLDELISTANDDKLSKNKNSSGEVTAPEIQCEVDFPTLASSAAVPYNKRQTKKSKKADVSLSARDEYMASSSSGAATEESESSGGSACSSSSPQSAHNTSSDGDFEGGSEITLVGGRMVNACTNSKTNRSILLPTSYGHFSDESGSYCYGPHHLWDDFRGDEVIALPSAPFTCTLGAPSCVSMSNLNHIISHCTCRRVDGICPSRPPPGFEHLARPAFPIELYDPSMLGNLISGQLPREVLASLDASAIPKKQFEEMEELLLSLTCCEKHAVDKILNSRKNSLSSTSGTTDTEETDKVHEDDWESLDNAIKSVLKDWTEELGFRRRMQDILYSLNLHDIFGGCCKRGLPELPEQENANYIFGSSSLSKSFANQDSASIFLRGGADP